MTIYVIIKNLLNLYNIYILISYGTADNERVKTQFKLCYVRLMSYLTRFTHVDAAAPFTEWLAALYSRRKIYTENIFTYIYNMYIF